MTSDVLAVPRRLTTLLAGLVLADAVTTYLVVANGGREGNPVVRHSIDMLGLVPAMAAKTIVMFALLGVMVWFAGFPERLVRYAITAFLVSVFVLMVAVQIDNVRVIILMAAS